MGYAILDFVTGRLEQEGFEVHNAYPGQRYPRIEDTVVTVHLEKVDRANLAVTVGVDVLCPASYGGVACEEEALLVTQVLWENGAVCVQNGCRYDGIAQVYGCQILASFTGVSDDLTCKLWPGFSCYVNSVALPYVTGFQAVERVAVEGDPVTAGQTFWEIQVEEQIPAGMPEAEDGSSGGFILRLELEDSTETYSSGKWRTVKRELDARGIHRMRTGYALGKDTL